MGTVNMLCPRCEVGLQFQGEAPRATICPQCGFAIRVNAKLVQSIPDGYEHVVVARPQLLDPTNPNSDNFDPSLLIKLDPEVQQCLRTLKRGTATVVGVLGVLWLVNWQWNKPQSGASSSGSSQAQTARPKTKVSAAELRNIKFGFEAADEQEKLATDLAREVVAASSSDDLLDLIRDRRVNETLFEKFYQLHPYEPKKVAQVSRSPYLESKFPIYHYEVTYEDGSKRHLSIGKTMAGDFKLDWPTFVSLSEVSWTDFLSQKSTEARWLRVIASLEGEGLNIVLKLQHPSDRDAPFIRVVLNQRRTVDRELLFHFENTKKREMALTLSLKHNLDPSRSPIELVQILATTWLVAER